MKTLEEKNILEKEFSLEHFQGLLEKAKLDLNAFIEEDKKINIHPDYKDKYKSSETKKQEKVVTVYENKIKLINLLNTEQDSESKLYEELATLTDEKAIAYKEHEIEVSQEVIRYLKEFIINKLIVEHEFDKGIKKLKIEGEKPDMVREAKIQADAIKERMAWS